MGVFTSETAQRAGRRGGATSSARKVAAARRNGKRGGRPGRVGTAHQYKIREQAALAEPREPLASLDGCRVEPITRNEARAVVLRYEWLATVGRPLACYGLRAPDGELLGVTSFGLPGAQASRDICGRDYNKVAICLERGACVYFAPRNAASFLIARAVKMAHLAHGWEIFYAYADPSAGEIGTIYQALGWHCLVRGVGRTPGRARDYFKRPDGKIVSERALRQAGVSSVKLRDVLGWERIAAPAKYKFVHFTGPRAAELRAACRYPFVAYPRRTSGNRPNVTTTRRA